MNTITAHTAPVIRRRRARVKYATALKKTSVHTRYTTWNRVVNTRPAPVFYMTTSRVDHRITDQHYAYFRFTYTDNAAYTQDGALPTRCGPAENCTRRVYPSILRSEDASQRKILIVPRAALCL